MKYVNYFDIVIDSKIQTTTTTKINKNIEIFESLKLKTLYFSQNQSINIMIILTLLNNIYIYINLNII